MNQQETDRARLLDLIERGAHAGKLSYAEINEALGALDFDEETAEALFEVLEKRSIAVVDEPRAAAQAAKKAAAAVAAATPVPAKPKAPPSTEHGDLDDVLASLESLEDVMANKVEAWQEALAAEAELEDEANPDAPLEDAYRQYTHRLAHVPRLTPDEELRLAKLAKSGNAAEQEAARQKLVESNWRLVVYLARGYVDRTPVPLNDLVQEGMIGMMRAVERFDPDRGQKLGAYATWWIRQAINRAIADQSRSMRLPGHMYAVMQKVRRTQSTLSQELGRTPSRQEVANALEMPLITVEEAMRAAMTPLSLESPVSGDEEMELGEGVAGDDEDEGAMRVSRNELHSSVEEALEALSDRERIVICKRFGIGDYASEGPQAAEDVAKQLHLSRERVRQLEIRALRKLRRRTRGTSLENAFGDGEEE